MKHLIIHIGHGKTGTSYIQSMLALNTQKLENLKIHYPYDRSFPGAQKGMITSGNQQLLTTENIKFGRHEHILISGENLFHFLLGIGNFDKKVMAYCDKVSVILYTRNVLDMLCSAWGQAVKRGGETSSLNEFLISSPDPHHAKVLQWIKLSERHGFKLYLKNYSNHTNDVFGNFFSTLKEIQGIDGENANEFVTPDRKQVNRSMTRAEYALIQSANKLSRQFGQALSDHLVNQLPEISSETPRISSEVKTVVNDRYEAIISEINLHLEKSELVELASSQDEKKNTTSELNESQLKIFEKTFNRFFKPKSSLKHNESNPSLQDINSSLQHIVKVVDDIALKIENNRGQCEVQDAIALKEIALQLRPNGPLMDKKLNKKEMWFMRKIKQWYHS